MYYFQRFRGSEAILPQRIENASEASSISEPEILQRLLFFRARNTQML
ncbi:hypothetical protein A2U01_0115668, partial [Trifolium medium]|nr:hypothetical protein [Trifolium medium]